MFEPAMMRLPFSYWCCAIGIMLIQVTGLKAQDTLTVLTNRVVDGQTNQPIAFATIFQQGTSMGTFSDIDGYFTLSISTQIPHIQVQCIGYLSIELSLTRLPEPILLFPDNVALKEVVIRPGINPAERIIRAAISKKQTNHPEKGGSFTYESYNRLVFDAQLDSSLVKNPDSLALKDSSTREMYQFFTEQHLFLMETVTKRRFAPPHHSEETIIANRVSGLKNTDFFVLATQLQSFSFYGNEVELMSKRYLSPLSDNSISKYLFILENTSIFNGDTIWTISYRPRKNKNFDGLDGVLYINSNQYAIQQVTAHPHLSESTDIRIQQQYQLVDNKRWFPVQLNSTLILNGSKINGAPMVGDGKSYIKNIHLDPPIDAASFGPVVLMMDKNASLANDSIWRKHRPDSVSIKDTRTYHVIDSIGKEIQLDKKAKLLESLALGKIPMGKLDLDLKHIMAYNQYEGFRLGVGLHTNEALMKNLSIGGYYAYGFRDAQNKFGGDIIAYLHRKRGIELRIAYSNDVMETGGNQLDKVESNWIKSTYPLFITRMDRREVQEISLRGRWWGNLNGILALSKQYIQTFDGYQWYQPSNELLTQTYDNFDLTEASVTMRFAPGEKLIRMGNREVRIGGKWPVLTGRFSQGLTDALGGDLHYQRYDFLIYKTFYILNVGELSTQINGGKISGDTPISLLYNARGTFKKFTIAVPHSFETMRTNEFMHDEFLALHLRHNFKHLLFRRPKFEPQLIVSHSSMFGRLSNTARHNVALRAAQLGYHETGLSITGLMKSNISNLGIGFFYRYGPYHLPQFQDNLAIKITSTFSF
jgi:Family of unknown function (DUF5686)/CarboxypepD_reg-like domain